MRNLTTMTKTHSDVIVIGAGAAGMMCAARAAASGLSVQLVDHAQKLGEKIRISGGGRCNFTNIGATWENYVSQNPRFARYALNHYKPKDFLALLERYQIPWHEKHKGQLFCDNSSQDIIEVLKNECDEAGVRWRMPCTVERVERIESAEGEPLYHLLTSAGLLTAKQLVVATGGMAIPMLGATDFGLRLARQFGLKIVEPRPALVPLVFTTEQWQPYAQLSGLSLEVVIANAPGKKAQRFIEDVLFTHRGLSGPGVLQISSYWDGHSPIYLNLNHKIHNENYLLAEKRSSKQQLITILSSIWPKRFAQLWPEQLGFKTDFRIAEIADKNLRDLALAIENWSVTPSGTAGYKKAEAMRGGVDTAALEQKTMQAKQVPGLYFIGEVVDMTGWLGGYNFQWSWSSAVVCADAMVAATQR
ncbi:MAG: aminoacetone oxidase family FAD-binding enzyme [Alcaligenaceae bacterium]|nr:aminoacetone oxidase family FAD-binding enzyme [Alcaligenaceae bacterium]